MSQTCSTTIISLFPNTEQSSVVAKITIRKRRKRQKSAKEQTQKEELKPKVVVISEDLFNPEYIAEVQKQKEKEEPEEENEEENEEAVDCSCSEDEIEDYDEDYDEDEDNDEDEPMAYDTGEAGVDGLGILFAQIRQYEPYTKEEEVAKFQKLNKYMSFPENEKEKVAILDQENYNRIAKEIALHNIRLVVKVAKKVYANNKRIPMEDMINQGVIGLYTAIEKFDVSKGFKFSTYAWNWIHQTIVRHIANTGLTIRVPVHYQESLRKAKRIESEYLAENGGEDAPDEYIADELGISLDKFNRYKESAQTVTSLNVPVDENETQMMDLLDDGDTPLETKVLNAELHEKLFEAIRHSLDKREAFIIINLYNLAGSDAPMDYGKLAKHLKLTKERIRQIEHSALLKLRHPSHSKGFRDYY